MGILKQGAIVCLGIVLFSRLQTWLEPRLPVAVDGYYHPAFKRVADKFRENVESGKERGGSIAVYHRGKLVVDMWGGYADVEARRPWTRDTMSLAFSVSKGVAAIVAASMVEKGHLDYKRLVEDYWPEFGQNGKDNVTVEMLFSHQAGLAGLDESINLFDLKDDPAKVEQILAAQKPLWPPGTAHGYHTVTYGLYVDTLLRKVDPKGRNTPQIFYEEFVKPFELDMFMNTPLDQYYRVTRLYEDPAWYQLLNCMYEPQYRWMFASLILDSGSVMAKSARSISQFKGAGVPNHNNPILRQLPCSCCYGTGTARGFAKLYSIIANGGVYNGKQMLSKDSIKKLATPLTTGQDETLGVVTSFGPGTGLKKNSEGFVMVGHSGHGGQNAFADLENELGISYITNFVSIYGYGDDPRYVSVEKEIYASLKDYIATLK